MPQYQGVWTLEQQAQAQSNQQWVTDPNFKNTTLLLQADGTGSGSQNQTFLDGSTNNFFITRNGNTTQGSFSPFSQAPGYWGNYFGGSSDYLTLPSNSANFLHTGAADWTFECWFWCTTTGSTQTLLSTAASSAQIGIFLGLNNISAGGISMAIYRSGANYTFNTNTNVWATNTWNHVAITYNQAANTYAIYLNGISQSLTLTGTASYNAGNATYAPAIGRFQDASPGGYFTGYISNMRTVNGTRVYTANFNPPTTPLTAITNTAFLTCQSNRFVDNSTNAYAVTANGTPSVQAFGPFAPALQWTPTVVGGSGYFDGTGDYLSIANNTAFDITQGDFLIEAWVYRSVAGVEHNIIGQRNVGNGYLFRINSNNTVSFSYVSVVGVTSTGTIPAQTWVYLAASRVGTNMRLFINGVIDGSTTSATNGLTSTGTLNIGADSTPANYMNGYLSSIRLVKGSGVSSISVPTAPANPTGTNVCLNFTNAGIYDGKMANVLETVGNAQVATSPVKYGSGSMYFDGSGDSLLTTSNAIFSLGSSDFTVEFWLYPISTNYGAIMYSTNNGSKTDAFAIYAYGSGQSPANSIVALITNSGGAAWSLMNGSSFGLTTAGAWQHVALVRNGSTFKGYLNGVAGFTVTSTSAIAAFNGFSIASNGASGDYFNGYIDDLRITRAARYIANFTPPQQALPRQ